MASQGRWEPLAVDEGSLDCAGFQMSRHIVPIGYCERRQACGNLQSVFLIENMRSPYPASRAQALRSR